MSSSQNNKKVFIIAAEDSSCLYAQRLMEYWQSRDLQIETFGIGDQKMRELGFEAIADAEDLSVVGFVEVLKYWPKIKESFNACVEQIRQRQPDVILLLDYPGFNLRLVKKVAHLNIPIVYYISPQLWAWKKSRIKIVQKYIDKMLVILPFEEDFYKLNNVAAQFVGHPLLDEIDHELLLPKEQNRLKQKYGIRDDEMVLGLMPGSRVSEIKYHLETQLDTARLLQIKYNKLKIALLLAPSFSREAIQALMPEGHDLDLIYMKAEPMTMLASVDFVLTASGTATLFVGLMKKPMVIMYKMNQISSWIAKILVKNMKFFGLVNIILKKEVAREHFQNEATPAKLCQSLELFIENADYKQKYIEEISQIHTALGDGGATKKVSEVVERYFK